jgi:hypothetical protein
VHSTLTHLALTDCFFQLGHFCKFIAGISSTLSIFSHVLFNKYWNLGMKGIEAIFELSNLVDEDKRL